jgi:hypothetical protein
MKPAAVFLLSLVPRLAYLLAARPPFEGDYWQLSTSLLSNGTLALDGVRTARYEPLYPLFLAGARAVSGGSMLGAQIVQCAAAATGGVFMFLLARKLAGERVAWYSAFLFAVHPLLIRHTADLSESALTRMLLLVFAAAFVRAETTGMAIGAGVGLGLAALTRAVVLPIAAPAAMVLAGRGSRSRGAWLLAATVVTTTPMLARDYAINGTLLPGRSGVNLFIGNNDYAFALLPEHSPDILQHYADQTSTSDRDLEALGWRWMAEHPVKAMVLKARNFWYFVSPFLVPSRLLLPETTITMGPAGGVAVTGAPLRPASERLLFTGFSTAVLALAAAGILSRRSDLAQDAILWCVFLSFAAVYSLYFPATRYTAAVAFVPIFYAAAGLEALTARVTARG